MLLRIINFYKFYTNLEIYLFKKKYKMEIITVLFNKNTLFFFLNLMILIQDPQLFPFILSILDEIF